MCKEKITKKRADYSKLKVLFVNGAESIPVTREKLTKLTGGYISDDTNYLKKKSAPLSRVAEENGYYIEKVEKIVVYFRKK